MNKNLQHLLIVDDDDKIRNLLKSYLIEHNFLISTAANAEEAKELLKLSLIHI